MTLSEHQLEKVRGPACLSWTNEGLDTLSWGSALGEGLTPPCRCCVPRASGTPSQVARKELPHACSEGVSLGPLSSKEL